MMRVSEIKSTWEYYKGKTEDLGSEELLGLFQTSLVQIGYLCDRLEQLEEVITHVSELSKDFATIAPQASPNRLRLIYSLAGHVLSKIVEEF